MEAESHPLGGSGARSIPFVTVDDIRIVGMDLTRSASWAYVYIYINRSATLPDACR